MDYEELCKKLKSLSGINASLGYTEDAEFFTKCSRAITALLTRAEKAEREREAAIKDMKSIFSAGHNCRICKHVNHCRDRISIIGNCPNLEWRGAKEG